MAKKRRTTIKPQIPSPRDEEERQYTIGGGGPPGFHDGRLTRDHDTIIKICSLWFQAPFLATNKIRDLLAVEHPDITPQAIRTIIKDALRAGLVTAQIRRPADPDWMPLHIRVCRLWLHYPHGSVRYVVEKLGGEGAHLKEDAITGIVQDALRRGRITASVNFRREVVERLQLETGLLRTFGQLQVAKVIEASTSVFDELDESSRRSARRSVNLQLAPLAAGIMNQYIQRRLRAHPDEDTIVAVGWGVTLYHLLHYLTGAERPWFGPTVNYVPFIGLTARPQELGLDAYNLATRLAELGDARGWALAAPALLGNAHAMSAKKFPAVARVLRMLESAHFVINSVAAVKDGGTGDRKLSNDPNVHDALKGSPRWQNVVGRIGLLFFDAYGRAIPLEHHRAIGMDLERLKKIASDRTRCALTITGGDPARVTALLGALRGGYISHLLTDEHTARALLHAQNGEQQVA